ncbi:MAG: Undecaprenyl-phosphate galactose phosphotransferase [Chthoniobacteraceae bacterium]|nr:Undecaprenyl-phosphate galactose phosphotransferase [Chthoniobacteraceae bacterium]
MLLRNETPDCLDAFINRDAFDVPKRDASRFPLWKRVLDLTCIALSIAIWASLMILVALWILLTSPGPIFFRQERIGHHGRRFTILKFRSMKVNTATGSHELHVQQLIPSDRPMTKLDALGDPRLIRGGRILRMLGLDELPQIFNVIRGEMSLVGPRPCTPHELGLYQNTQLERFNAPPGLTGYWQINGKNKTTFSRMVDLDIFYSRHMSLWLDLLIILKTLPSITLEIYDSFKKPVLRAS